MIQSFYAFDGEPLIRCWERDYVQSEFFGVEDDALRRFISSNEHLRHFVRVCQRLWQHWERIDRLLLLLEAGSSESPSESSTSHHSETTGASKSGGGGEGNERPGGPLGASSSSELSPMPISMGGMLPQRLGGGVPNFSRSPHAPIVCVI